MNKVRQNSDKGDKILASLPDIFTREQVENILQYHRRSAQRLIKKLLNQGQIEIKEKTGIRVVYKKKEIVFSGYQQSFLDTYIPNKTNFLSKAELKHLEKLAVLNTKIDLATYTAKIYERLIIDISWASSKLEGNTYSLLETEKLLLHNETTEGKNTLDTQMILNHKEAIKFLVINREKITLNEYTLKSIHALLSENILSNPSAMGALRKIPVGITGTKYTPLSIPQQIEEEFSVFIKKAAAIKNPLEQAFFILVFIPYLQPFEDLNKRSSRISCNVPLLKNKLIPISFKSVDTADYISALKKIYEQNNCALMKVLFIKAIEFSAQDYANLAALLVPPSSNLIKYRQEIKDLVYHCVVKGTNPSEEDLTQVPEEARIEILNQVKIELKHLHEGSLIRFNLTPAQFLRWKKWSR